MITDGLGNVTMSKDEYQAFYDGARERAALAIFAAMQANPNWDGSLKDEERAIEAADRLITALYRRY